MEEIHKFSDFAEDSGFTFDGNKISIDNILNTEIVVYNYKISKSKFKDTPCLTLQIELNGEKRIVFTSGSVLQKQCEQYAKEMPFKTKIIKVNKYYKFT